MTELKEQHRIVRIPRVTEKGTADQEKNNAYHFEVASNANKVEIRQAVEKLFSVKVISVNTVRMKGKSRRKVSKRSQSVWATKEWKKAIVRLKAGDTIALQ